MNYNTFVFPLGLSSHLFSLSLPSLKTSTTTTTKSNNNGKKSPNSFLNENKCMKEWNPQKPTKQDRNDTTILSHHPYHFANYEHHKTSTCTLDCAHSLNECITTHRQGTQHCSIHSFLCIRQPISAMLPCSVAIKLQTPTTQFILHACQHALHIQHYPLHCLP